VSEAFNKEEYLADLKRRQNLVTISDGCLSINGPSQYEIALSRCATAEAILQWVRHLSEKTWVTTEIIEQFVVVSSGNIGLNIDTVPS
jgi:hypothetical protein